MEFLKGYVSVFGKGGGVEKIFLSSIVELEIFSGTTVVLNEVPRVFNPNTFTWSRLTSDVALLMSSTLPSVSIMIILACVPGRQVNNETLELELGWRMWGKGI